MVSRVFLTMHIGSILHIAWNAFLAIVPVVTAYAVRGLLDRRPTSTWRYLLGGALAVVWFVFLPNTCYLLTQWRHYLTDLDSGNLYLRATQDSVLFIKLVIGSLFYFLYALFGMLTFAMAIRPIERLAIKRGILVKFWAVPFFAAVSLGVYLGLVLRFNSWDFATSPARIWQSVVEVGGRPLLAAMILAFGAFLWASYESADIWLDGLKHRVLRGKSEA